MVADEQTQRLPFETRAARALRANSAATRGLPTFETALTHHLTQRREALRAAVRGCAGARAPKPAASSSPASRRPETLATLRAMGFQNPAGAAETVRGWHFGRRAAVRSARAREVLTELTPGSSRSLRRLRRPDAALAAFDAALARMPAAVELLSILRSNADVRELFGDILGGAPRLAAGHCDPPARARRRDRPGARRRFRARPRRRCDARRAEVFIAQSQDLEEALNRARDFAAEEMFLIGVRSSLRPARSRHGGPRL